MAKVATTVTLDEKECKDAIMEAAKKQLKRDADTGNGGCNLELLYTEGKLTGATLAYQVK